MSRKKTNLWLFLGTVGVLFVMKRVSKAESEELRNRLMTYGIDRIPASSNKIPEGKRWQVELRNGDRLIMTSSQLQNALDARAVKTYAEVTSKA